MFIVPVYSLVITLPYEEKFNSGDYDTEDSLVWLTKQATHTYVSDGGWSGGAAKFTPPKTEGGYSGLGSFTGLSEKILHVRILVKMGTTYTSTAVASPSGYGSQNKWSLVHRDNGGSRAMTMLEFAAPDDEYYPGMADYYTFGACDNNACTFEGDSEQNFPYGLDTFQTPDYEGEWICVEVKYNLTNQTSTIYIWTQDEVFAGEYVTGTYSSGEGNWSYVEIIGGYFNGYHPTQDANTYIMYDELKIDTSYIGPPSGFTDSNVNHSGGGSGWGGS